MQAERGKSSARAWVTGLPSGRAVLLDVREPANYENAHAGGAVSAPHVSVQAAGGRLPAGVSAPADALLILYCA